MKKEKFFSEEYKLSASAIDIISEKTEKLCLSYDMDSKAVKRYRFSIEECLLIWLKNSGEGKSVWFEVGSRFGKPYLRIRVAGKQCNPYENKSEDFGLGEKSMLMNVGLIPMYTYTGNENVLTFNIIKKSGNQILSLLFIIFMAFLVGIIGKLIIPENILSFIIKNITSPVESTFFRILSCIAGPMIFLSVAWGVYGIGDVYTLGRVGKKLMINFVRIVFLFASLGIFTYHFLGPELESMSSQTSQFGKVLQMLLDIVPSDIFSPFVNSNTLQIIFIAFVIGLSMIYLGQRTSSVAKAIEQINNIISFLMNFVSKLVPYFVFIVLVQMVWSDSFTKFSSVWIFSITYIASFIIIHTAYTLYVAIKHKVSPLILVKICIPSFLIGITTASSSAAFESNMTISQNKLGVSGAFASFGVPFGMVLFKPSTSLYYTLICFYFANVYSDTVHVSVSWILTTIIITSISAIATPPIPGGAAATYTILFTQLGIPGGALAVALTIDMIFDFILTSGDMYALLLEMYHVSFKVNMRKDIIHSKMQVNKM